jgi:hypothetical protein
MIESYAFGRLVFSGKTYTSDLIIYPERIDPSWWRKTGHRLCLQDLQEVLEEDLEVLVVGTGYMGLMEVEEEVKRYAETHGFQLIVDKTRKAVEIYNSLHTHKKTVGAFHLTC